MNAKMIRYYQKKMHGGRSIVARGIDCVFFRLFIATILFSVLLYLSRSFAVSLLIALLLTTAASLALLIVNRNKTKRFIETDLQRIKEKCLLETLTFMNARDFIAYLDALFDGFEAVEPWGNGFTALKNAKRFYAFHNHPQTKVNVPDILDILRNGNEPLVFVSLSDFHEDVKSLCKSMEQNVALINGTRLLKIAAENDMLPDENEAQQRAENEMKQTILTLDKIKRTAIQKTKIKRYILCGIVVLLWSIVTGFRIYYPFIAAVCFLLALIAVKQHREDKESSGSGAS